MNKPMAPSEPRSERPAPVTLVPTPPPAPARSGRRKSWTIGGLLGLIVIAAVGAAWWSVSTGGNVRYVTAAVTRGPVTRAVTATGSFVSGTIRDIECDYNTQVKKGQVCAKIDPRPYQTVVDQAKANLAQAQAQLAKDQANLDYAQLPYNRNEQLARTNAISKDTFDNSKNALDQAQAQIGVDQATIARARSACAWRSARVACTYCCNSSPRRYS
jgi:HlyD family secretion protein